MVRTAHPAEHGACMKQAMDDSILICTLSQEAKKLGVADL